MDATSRIQRMRRLQARRLKRLSSARAVRAEQMLPAAVPVPPVEAEEPSVEGFLWRALVMPSPGAKATPDGVKAVRLLLEGCRSPRTRKAYQADLGIFARWLQTDREGAASHLLAVPRLLQANALAFAWSESMAHLSASTRNRRLSLLRTLTKVAKEVGIVSWTLAVPGVRTEPVRDMRGPDLDTVKRMIAITGEDLGGVRDRALVLLSVTLGLRRQETADLLLRDYDQENRNLSFVGKGNKSASLAVPPSVAEHLEAWIKASGISEKEQPLFHSLRCPGRPLSVSGISYIVGSLGQKAGAVVRSNGLRHAAVTIGLDATGGDVRKVRQLARHVNAGTTLLYDDARQDFAGQVSDAIAEKLKKGTE